MGLRMETGPNLVRVQSELSSARINHYALSQVWTPSLCPQQVGPLAWDQPWRLASLVSAYLCVWLNENLILSRKVRVRVCFARRYHRPTDCQRYIHHRRWCLLLKHPNAPERPIAPHFRLQCDVSGRYDTFHQSGHIWTIRLSALPRLHRRRGHRKFNNITPVHLSYLHR